MADTPPTERTFSRACQSNEGLHDAHLERIIGTLEKSLSKNLGPSTNETKHVNNMAARLWALVGVDLRDVVKRVVLIRLESVS